MSDEKRPQVCVAWAVVSKAMYEDGSGNYLPNLHCAYPLKKQAETQKEYLTVVCASEGLSHNFIDPQVVECEIKFML